MDYFKLEIESSCAGHKVVLTAKPSFKKAVKKFIAGKKTKQFSVDVGGNISKTMNRALVKKQIKPVLASGGEIFYSAEFVKDGKVKLNFFGRNALSSFVKRTAKSARLLDRYYQSN